MIKVKSDLTKALMKEYGVDTTTSANITGGTIVTLDSSGTVCTLPTNGSGYSTVAKFLVLTDPATSYSRVTLNQVTVIWGGTVEIETDNVTFTAGAVNPGDIIYVGVNGKLTTTSTSNTAIGFVEKATATTLYLRLTLS